MSDRTIEGKSENETVAVALFDAVGTVMDPFPDVADVYFRLGREYGSSLSREEIKSRFGPVRKQVFGELGFSSEGDHPFELSQSSDEIEFQLWKQVVFGVFGELDRRGELFADLWTHFSIPGSWRLEADVVQGFERLKSRGVKIGLASNFDSRLIPIVENMKALSGVEFVFCSAQIGWRKPDHRFYLEIQNRIRGRLGLSASDRVKIGMVGDDLTNDCLAPAEAGWHAAWLNRQAEVGPELDSEVASPGILTVGSLSEYVDWFVQLCEVDD